jgi:pSer/pThr/pTyr-binding forkhead associated (FHA) protein
MDLKLVVIGGKQAGTEVRIRKPQYVIGRGEECHLRPQSHLVSRKHCAITVEDGKVVIEDFSTNGTFVNDERIEKRRELANGDRLKVGGLELEIRFDAALTEKNNAEKNVEKKPVVATAPKLATPPTEKKPTAVAPTKPAAVSQATPAATSAAKPAAVAQKTPIAVTEKTPAIVKTFSAAKVDDDLEISNWLSEGNDASDGESVADKFSVDSHVDLAHDTITGHPSDDTTTSMPAEKSPPKKEEKKPPVHIPGQFKKVAKPMAESSRSAAEDMLRQFFPRKKP